MKVVQLNIQNFRGIKSSQLNFDGHTLLVGPNNVGKSTICEALDLVLGPDRISRTPPVEEFDFHNALYIQKSPNEDGEPTPIPIIISVVITDLNIEIENRCSSHIEFWNTLENRILRGGEILEANPPNVVSCLRLETRAFFNHEEDDFEAQTYFIHSPNTTTGELVKVSKNIKRIFGFIYLRAIRTGSRALSLERGSLLDLIIRLGGTKVDLWETAINRLSALDIESDATELHLVLQSIEDKLNRYIPKDFSGRTTKLHVSQLTREHLRKTMSFFLTMSKDQKPVPFQHVGTGTLNILVLALLSFIAELKPSSVIFAMEEPEIALPPHTQRRIVDYLLKNTTQSFTTSHSPFVIERFEPNQTLLLSRGVESNLLCQKISDSIGLKGNDFRRYARRGLTECMLGKGVIVVEGLTEFHALPVIARKMEEADSNLQPLDIAGVVFFDAETEGNMPKFGKFFKSLGLKTFGFYDFLSTRSPQKKQELTTAFDIDLEHKYSGFEELIILEIPMDRQWAFLEELRISGDCININIPTIRPADNEVQALLKSALKSNKGTGWAARLLEGCSLNELPPTIKYFIQEIYALFPKSVEIQDEVILSVPAEQLHNI